MASKWEVSTSIVKEVEITASCIVVMGPGRIRIQAGNDEERFEAVAMLRAAIEQLESW